MKTDAHAHVVYTPLKRGAAHRGGAAGDRTLIGADAGASSSACRHRDPHIRAENEDDDGYDPYSDRRDEPPLFEPDPWN